MNGERIETVVQTLIMLAIGGMAGAASFTHVHDVAVAHGQPDWIGWADAVVVELMSIALGLELRRRARLRRPVAFVVSALFFFVAVSLAAQVIDAERSVIGWIAAAIPAIGFMVLVKIVLSRTAATATKTANQSTTTDTTFDAETTEPVATPPHPAPMPVPASVVTQLVDEQHGNNGQADVVDEPDSADPEPDTPDQPVSPAPVQIPSHLLPTARFSVVNHQQTTGRPITATELAARLSISPDVAGQLLHAVTGPTAPVNGSPVGGTR